MIRAWLSRHRSLLVSAVSGTAIVAVVATVAIVSTGYTAQHVQLGDGSVWVANSQQQAIGRANTEVLELNSVIASSATDVDVLQRGATVLMFDRSGNSVGIVDAATSAVTDTVPLPPQQPELFLAGSNVVVFERGTGRLWIRAAADLARFDAQSEATLSLGADAAVSVDPAGILFAVSASTGQLHRLDAAAADALATDTVTSSAISPERPVPGQSSPPNGNAAVQLTSVSGRPVALDAATGRLFLPDRTVDVSTLSGGATAAVLQWPSQEGSAVLVATPDGLTSIPLDGTAPVTAVSGKSGVPARPLQLGTCRFGAWTSGASWRQCDGGAEQATSTVAMTAPAMAGNARLSFVTNGDRAVLNDQRSGATWAVQRSSELIDNWDQLIPKKKDQPEDQQNNENLPLQTETVQQPPVAVDDAFGARPGKATVLPVLLNDYDPNGDVLVISDLVPLDPSLGRIDLINDRQQIQITLPPGATGDVRFAYTITDGRGGSASATVTVSARAASQNAAPKQVRVTKAVVAVGGRVSTQVLADWIDPDGDAFYLTSASAAPPASVTYKPGGTVVFTDAAQTVGGALVALTVSDGSAQGSGSLAVDVRAVDDSRIITDPFVMLAVTGQEITVRPLDHVRGGAGTVRLNSVPAQADVTITPSYETGTFRFASDRIGTHYLDFVVTDGTSTVTGMVRVDVLSPPEANTAPITVPKTVFVQSLRTERLDVAGTDVDPAGGVLLVTGLMNMPGNSGVRAEILEQRFVRVSLTAPLDSGPVSFNYRISNGLAEAVGVVTVVEIPTPTRVQPPVAVDDAVTVRVGQAIDIPVLDNDEHPDGLDLTLQPRLDQALPDGSGLLFVSGRVLRYLAPMKTGNFTAAYRVTGPDGQAATGLVRIAVREPDVATNNPPVPRTVTARVIAGHSVQIAIPLSGIDPDGDSTQLLGQASNPQRGAVTSVSADSILYQAGDYSAGTDTFTYSVIDALGARAVGTVRVGISPRVDGARNPVAVLDEVTVQPGLTASVKVLGNDSDPDSSPLSVTSATPNDAVTKAVVVGDIVQVTPPTTPGVYGVIYAIQNQSGGTSQNFIRITVDPNAPLAYPVATDSILTLTDVLDRTVVIVDVLANVFLPDGDSRSVGLSVYPGYGNVARVTAAKRIEVTVGNRSQIIPFRVTHPRDDSIASYAFIRVPGFDDALPQLDRRAPALKVKSEDSLTIDLNAYVIAVGGRKVSLTDSSTVAATHTNGSALVVDRDTLTFTSADKYFGPASISFEVTDATSATDPNARTSILVLPITVEPRDNQPPVFGGAVLDFEPGQQKQLDLLKLTTYPYPKDLGELTYTVLNTLPSGFTFTLAGSILTLKADNSAVKGSRTAMTIGVRDSIAEGGAGRIDLAVVPSTRPLVAPAPDRAIAKRGSTTSVAVLDNDAATNPFPDQPLKVIDIRGVDSSTRPPGVLITPSTDRATLTVTVATDVPPGDITLQYQVADATNDPDRYVWGTVTISVQDRPDPVSGLAPTGFANQSITLRWNAGAANNSPITGYRVVSSRGDTVTSTTTCTGTTCPIPTDGNGPANSVTVTVIATNSIGDSDPVVLSQPVWSDVIPIAPTTLSSVALDRGLRLSWDQVAMPSGGSTVDRYRVSVGAFSTDVSPAACSAGTCTLDTLAAGWSLDNGVAVAWTVSPRNGALTALSVWNTSEPRSDVPAGPPAVLASPLAAATSDTAIDVTWAGAFSPNGRAVTAYTAAAYTSGAPTCNASGVVSANGAALAAVGTGTAASFSGLSPNGEYSIVVFAYNGQGCTASPVVTAHTAPGIITALTTSGLVDRGDGTFDFTFVGGSMDALDLSSDYTILYRLIGTDVPATEYGPIVSGAFLTADAQQYGHDVSVQARACRSWGSSPICQATWSASFALGVPVHSFVTGLKFVPDDAAVSASGTFTWLGLPSGSYENVEVRCGPLPGVWVNATDLTCHADADLTETAIVTVRVTANAGQLYEHSYRGVDYE